MPLTVVRINLKIFWQPGGSHSLGQTFALIVASLINRCSHSLLPNEKNTVRIFALPLSKRLVAKRTLESICGPIPVEHAHNLVKLGCLHSFRQRNFSF